MQLFCAMQIAYVPNKCKELIELDKMFATLEKKRVQILCMVLY